jgi:hypothetical protein
VRYEEPPYLSRDEADRVLSSALDGQATSPDANSVLVGLAMFDADRAFVESWCIASPTWRRIYGLAVSPASVSVPISRRFGAVSERAAETVHRLAADPQMRSINPQVLDARDDLLRFTSRA